MCSLTRMCSRNRFGVARLLIAPLPTTPTACTRPYTHTHACTRPYTHTHACTLPYTHTHACTLPHRHLLCFQHNLPHLGRHWHAPTSTFTCCVSARHYFCTRKGIHDTVHTVPHSSPCSSCSSPCSSSYPLRRVDCQQLPSNYSKCLLTLLRSRLRLRVLLSTFFKFLLF